MSATPPPLRRPQRMVGALQVPPMPRLRPLPLHAARWGLVAAVSVLWVGQGVLREAL
jgi:hypothetical protein